MMDLDIGICSEIEKKQKKTLLLDYLWENLRYILSNYCMFCPVKNIRFFFVYSIRYHNWWAYRYYVCEFLSLVNVIGEFVLLFIILKKK